MGNNVDCLTAENCTPGAVQKMKRFVLATRAKRGKSGQPGLLGVRSWKRSLPVSHRRSAVPISGCKPPRLPTFCRQDDEAPQAMSRAPPAPPCPPCPSTLARVDWFDFAALAVRNSRRSRSQVPGVNRQAARRGLGPLRAKLHNGSSWILGTTHATAPAIEHPLGTLNVT